MEDISALIKEAKPLYFARKRRNRIIKGAMGVIACFFLINISLLKPQEELYDSWTQQLYITESGSVIEDMGLPVDEYGLLMVG